MRIPLASIAALLLFVGRASAQDQPAVPGARSGATAQAALPSDNPASRAIVREDQPAPVPLEDHVEMKTPNRKLLWASAIAFGAAYVPGVVVATTSSNTADRYLLIPVVGPWVDLAVRHCTAPSSTTCTDSTWNGVGLFASGLVQLVGAVGTALSFTIPESIMAPVRPASFPNGGFGVVVTLVGNRNVAEDRATVASVSGVMVAEPGKASW